MMACVDLHYEGSCCVCQAGGEGEAGVGSAEWAGRNERVLGASQEEEQRRFPVIVSLKCITNQVLQSKPCHTSSPILFVVHMHPLSADSVFFLFLLEKRKAFSKVLLSLSAQISILIWIALTKCCVTELQAYSCSAFCPPTVYGFW